MRPTPWTRDELKEFVHLYPTTDIEVLMRRYGRSYRSIVMKAYTLRVRQVTEMRAEQGRRAHLQFVGPRLPRTKWSPEVVNRLLEEYPCVPNKDLAKKYGVTARAICQLANRYDVKKSKEYLSVTSTNNNLKRYQKN